MEYRDEEVNSFMLKIEEDLVAISEKHSKTLGVIEILKRDPLTMYDKAVTIGMRETANDALIKVIALSTGLDRIIAMVNQMADTLDAGGNHKKAKMFRNRLNILTNFERIVKEFDPSKIKEFAHSPYAVKKSEVTD